VNIPVGNVIISNKQTIQALTVRLTAVVVTTSDSMSSKVSAAIVAAVGSNKFKQQLNAESAAAAASRKAAGAAYTSVNAANTVGTAVVFKNSDGSYASSTETGK
jgi:hypothetical protein